MADYFGSNMEAGGSRNRPCVSLRAVNCRVELSHFAQRLRHGKAPYPRNFAPQAGHVELHRQACA